MTAPTVPAAIDAVAPDLDPNHRPVAQGAWTLYDFANTMFSFAVVSGAIGLYLVNDRQFGERDGNVVLSLAIIVSVALNAAVSPILGAFSDCGGRRMPFLLGFTALCIGATFFIADVPPVLGVALFIVANFAYQAALIYYDATLKTVSTPAQPRQAVGDRHRHRLLRDGVHRPRDLPARHPRPGPLPADVDPVPRVRHPDLLVRARAAPRRTNRRSRAADVADSFGQLKRSIAHSQDRPRPVAVPDRALLLLGRRQHRHRRDERGGREDHGRVRGDGQRDPARCSRSSRSS